MSDVLELERFSTDALIQVRKTLAQTGAYLDRFGWTQTKSGSHGGPRCLTGAVFSAIWHRSYMAPGDADSRPDLLQKYHHAYRALELELADDSNPPPFAWNDVPGRTLEEVQALLLAAREHINEILAARAASVPKSERPLNYA
jgi:hypothetical protein